MSNLPLPALVLASVMIGDVAAAQDTEPAKQYAMRVRASANQDEASRERLVGSDVMSASGDNLGTIHDVLVDVVGRSSYVIIHYGDGKYTAIPLRAVESQMRGDTLVLKRKELENAPSLRYQEWLGAQRGWTELAAGYWQKTEETLPSASPGAPTESDTESR